MTNEIEGIDNEVKKRTEQMINEQKIIKTEIKALQEFRGQLCDQLKAEKSCDKAFLISNTIRGIVKSERELSFKLMKP